MIDARLTPLLNDTKAQKIFAALDGYETRFVGGCVRDALMERKIGDIDLATTALPEQVMKILSAHKIQVIPTGIDHGTVTAVIDKTTYEITTLRKDVTTDGRRAAVAFSQDWQEDALRRDFTINAISMDANGQLYDYYDGQKDIANKTLRFIGEPKQRITEDYLRILRFFRFASVFDWPINDLDGLDACAALAPNLKSLSRERIQAELYKLLLGNGALRIINLMAQNAILDELKIDLDIARFENVVALEQKNNEPNAFRRLLALTGWQDDPEFIVLSRDNKKDLKTLRKMQDTDWSLEKILYFFGAETTLDYFYLQNNLVDYDTIKNWQKPVFPLQAEDVFHLTNGPGVLVGQKMKQAEMHWVDSGFKSTKSELLALIA